jgi:hypothetical protein
MQRYVEQTKTIVDLLKKMEEVVLPKSVSARAPHSLMQVY